ncbi:class I SAM-dependent methyltransferase [Streptomyces sp900116325]|uniref:class I SAM-dependent methyltransferase n=1 Tax=Streptomyces sp. 900116325 TaxID=3154295 RepID=UPI0033A0BFF5
MDPPRRSWPAPLGIDHLVEQDRFAADRASFAQMSGACAAEPVTSALAVYTSDARGRHGPGRLSDPGTGPQPWSFRLRSGGAAAAVCLVSHCWSCSLMLQELGHHVIGVDASPHMLAQARKRLPGADFLEADLHRLPLPDNAVDTVICALALTHVPDLAPVLAEFARVLRPGGNLVISDAHLLVSYLRPTLARRPGPDGRPSLLAEYHRPLSTDLAAAIPLGFQVRHCEEPRRRRHSLNADTAPRTHSRPT